MELTVVKYIYQILDASRKDEIVKRMVFDIDKSCVVLDEDDLDIVTAINYEEDPDEPDNFLYGWEWENERFIGAIKLINVIY